MKILFTCLLLPVCLLTFSQQDTIVITDYTKILVEIDNDGDISPIASLDIEKAGFFINAKPQGQIRICHPDLFVWVNGRLFDKISGCKIYDPDSLLGGSKMDTLYLSLSSKSSLDQLVCELIIYEELLVVKEEVSAPRNSRSILSEFVIISLIFLLILLGVIVSSQSSRVSYMASKTFTFKISAYEFVNTNFYSGSSMYLLSFFSVALAFLGIYLSNLLGLGWVEQKSIFGLLWIWLQFSVVIFLIIIMKWIVVSLIAKLFYFKGLKNFQLFDFLNFNLVLLIPVLGFIALDFVLNNEYSSWVSSGFVIVFPIILILFVLWFTLKFVNNSPRKKLVIISYLCATEIIPATILLGWFFK
ncbi:DUF4271 domain-containing protein [Ekhidna sp.]